MAIIKRIDIGKRIEGRYLGKVVTGTITDSRVVYGGDIKYTVSLDTPLQREIFQGDQEIEVVGISQDRMNKVLD